MSVTLRTLLFSLSFVVTSEIPVGAGLGSSAAYSVALAGAFHRLNVGGGLRHHASGKPPSTTESFAPDEQVIRW